MRMTFRKVSVEMIINPRRWHVARAARVSSGAGSLVCRSFTNPAAMDFAVAVTGRVEIMAAAFTKNRLEDYRGDGLSFNMPLERGLEPLGAHRA